MTKSETNLNHEARMGNARFQRAAIGISAGRIRGRRDVVCPVCHLSFIRHSLFVIRQ
jgi:hypothetical protein